VLIDFQPQMFMGVESHDRNAIKNNLQIIAKSAKLFNVPTALSTVTAATFSGPFVPEVTEGVFPGHEVVDRTSINAWLTPDFVKAVEATGRKRLVVAGLWTGACAAFNVIEGLRRGYEVFFVADACGDASIQAHERAVDRMVQARAVPTTAQHFVYELQQDWNRLETCQGVIYRAAPAGRAARPSGVSGANSTSPAVAGPAGRTAQRVADAPRRGPSESRAA
jgi:nicotinamidase-related amidase